MKIKTIKPQDSFGCGHCGKAATYSLETNNSEWITNYLDDFYCKKCLLKLAVCFLKEAELLQELVATKMRQEGI